MKEMFEEFYMSALGGGCGCKTKNKCSKESNVSEDCNSNVKSETMNCPKEEVKAKTTECEKEKVKEKTTCSPKEKADAEDMYLPCPKIRNRIGDMCWPKALEEINEEVEEEVLSEDMEMVDSCNQCVFELVGYAQAYVPYQMTYTLLQSEKALACGTAFMELVSPYK